MKISLVFKRKQIQEFLDINHNWGNQKITEKAKEFAQEAVKHHLTDEELKKYEVSVEFDWVPIGREVSKDEVVFPGKINKNQL